MRKQLIRYQVLFAACLLAAVGSLTAAPAPTGTLIYDGNATEIASANIQSQNASELWLSLADLRRATRFELKPKGVCRDELCFPLPKARTAAFLLKQGKSTWFNLTEFAKLVRQPVAYEASKDTGKSVWLFGPRADEQNGYISSLQAPDFKLPDMNGKQHALSDFLGKKVLLLTWASW